MKVKKFVLCAALTLSVLSTSMVSHADSLSNLRYSTPNLMVDKIPAEEKTTVREPLEGFDVGLRANPVNTSSLKCTKIGVKATSTSSSTVREDSIMAKVRIYKNGALLSQKADTQKNSSYAGMSLTHPNGYFGASIAYGNHEYKLKGYKTVIHETKAKW